MPVETAIEADRLGEGLDAVVSRAAEPAPPGFFGHCYSSLLYFPPVGRTDSASVIRLQIPRFCLGAAIARGDHCAKGSGHVCTMVSDRKSLIENYLRFKMEALCKALIEDPSRFSHSYCCKFLLHNN